MTAAIPLAADDLRSSTDAPMRRRGKPAFARLGFVDNARAIGIVLVVAGHAPGLPARLVDFIFAFHIPLFFFLSGVLVDERHLRLSLSARARSLARTLLVPYAFFFAVAYVYWLVAKRHGVRALEMEALPWWDPLVGFLRGNGDRLYVDVVLWFFPCLFVTALVHHALRKRCADRTTTIVAVASAILFIAAHDPSDARWVWSVDCAAVAIAFFSFGASLHGRLVGGGRVQGFDPTRVAIAIVLAVACAALSIAMGRADLNNLAFGTRPSLYLPAAAVGIASVLLLASSLPVTRLAVWLSSNTVVIFPLHFLVFSVLTGIGIVVFGLDPGFRQTGFAAIVYGVLALAACYPAERLIRAAAPWSIGAGRRRSIDAAGERDATNDKPLNRR